MLEEYKSNRQKQEVFHTYTCINTISEFEKWYDSNINLSSKIYYRGVKDAKYKNYTSAQRYCINNNINDLPLTIVGKRLAMLRRANNNLIEQYCYSSNIECTDLFLMSLAQHYEKGFSLFLDFSLDINTALFFMCDKVSHVDTKDNSIENYASMYYSKQIGVPFDDVVNLISAKSSFTERNNTNNLFQKSSRHAFNTLLSLGIFNLLFGGKPKMIENKAYSFNLSYLKNKFSTNVIISNFNIVAQEGCLLFYDNELRPLEEELCCVDVHKSLIPSIKRRYLIPNNKKKKNLFPKLNAIVKDTFINEEM